MPKYVLISNHPPNTVPSASEAARKRGDALEKELPPLMQKHQLKPELMVHLDPGHRVLFVLEGPSAEAVRDFVYESGLGQWNDFEFHLASTLDWITQVTDKLPTIF